MCKVKKGYKEYFSSGLDVKLYSLLFFFSGKVGDFSNQPLQPHTKEALDEWIEKGTKEMNIKFRYSLGSPTKEAAK